MEQCTSWKARSFSASQEILNILWNVKVYCRVHSHLLHCPILINVPLVYGLPSQVCQVVCFLQCSPLKLSFLFSPLCSTCPTHLIILNLITQYLVNKIWRFRSCNFLHSPVASSFLGPNISLSTLFLNTHHLCPSINARDQVSHPYKTKGIKYTYVCFILYIFRYISSTGHYNMSCRRRRRFKIHILGTVKVKYE